MVRKLKHGVGICKCCGSSAVYRYYYLKHSRTKVWEVVCCNPKCRKRSSGFVDPNDALSDWKSSWDKYSSKEKYRLYQ